MMRRGGNVLLLLWLSGCGGPATPPGKAPAAAEVLAPATIPPPAPATPVVAPQRQPRVIFDTPEGPVPVLVEIARTEEERRRGLMHREHLEPGRGMLFLMEQQRPQVFWMKNTLIPLDMIFINEAMEVVGVVEQAVPLDETPRGVRTPSRWVVEIPGGHARLSGIVAGSRMRVVDVPDFPPPAVPDDSGPP